MIGIAGPDGISNTVSMLNAQIKDAQANGWRVEFRQDADRLEVTMSKAMRFVVLTPGVSVPKKPHK